VRGASLFSLISVSLPRLTFVRDQFRAGFVETANLLGPLRSCAVDICYRCAISHLSICARTFYFRPDMNIFIRKINLPILSAYVWQQQSHGSYDCVEKTRREAERSYRSRSLSEATKSISRRASYRSREENIGVARDHKEQQIRMARAIALYVLGHRLISGRDTTKTTILFMWRNKMPSFMPTQCYMPAGGSTFFTLSFFFFSFFFSPSFLFSCYTDSASGRETPSCFR
jgi:hypothetical protein